MSLMRKSLAPISGSTSGCSELIARSTASSGRMRSMSPATAGAGAPTLVAPRAFGSSAEPFAGATSAARRTNGSQCRRGPEKPAERLRPWRDLGARNVRSATEVRCAAKRRTGWARSCRTVECGKRPSFLLGRGECVPGLQDSRAIGRQSGSPSAGPTPVEVASSSPTYSWDRRRVSHSPRTTSPWTCGEKQSPARSAARGGAHPAPRSRRQARALQLVRAATVG